MMKAFLKYQGILYSLLLAIVVLAYVVSDIKHNDKVDQLAQQIQNRLQNDEVLLQEVMLNLQEVLVISGIDAYEQKSLEYQSRYKDRFAFFLYEKNKLSLWSDNHIPFPEDESLLSDSIYQHLGSYQFLMHKNSFHSFSIIGLQILKLDYPWQNEYLQNHLAPYLKITADLKISKTEGVPVISSEGESLFKVVLLESNADKRIVLFSFLLFVISFFLLAVILKRVLRKLQKVRPFLSLLLFVIGIAFWFALHVFMGIPEHIFQSRLFSPSIYANTWIPYSLGSIFFMSLGFLLIVIYYFTSDRRKLFAKQYLYFYSPLIYLLFFAFIYLMKSIVDDSQIFLNLYQLASLNIYSYVVLWIVFVLLLSWFLLLYRWIGHFSDRKNTSLHFWFSLALSLIIPIALPQASALNHWIIYSLVSILLIVVFYLQQRKWSSRYLLEALFYLIFFTLITSWYLNNFNRQKEIKTRQNKALTLGLDNDPFLESYFLSALDEIATDRNIQSIILDKRPEETHDSLLNYMIQTYFHQYNNSYNINLIQCDENSLINILPENIERPCYDYFQERISAAKYTVAVDTMYLTYGSYQYKNYIGIVNISLDTLYTAKIFLEFVSAEMPKELGLPAILEKSHTSHQEIEKKYSYAFYQDGVLSEWYGRFDYKQKLNDYRRPSYHQSFFVFDNYSHYVFSKDENTVLIISLKLPGTLKILASYAFVFLFYSLMVFFLYALFFTEALSASISSFQGRLQYSMIVLLLFSFILTGLMSLYYIFYLNREKNEELLMEKAHSVLIELEHKIMGIEDFGSQDQAYIEGLLVKFSEVFFTDITLYDRNGVLLASSRPEMFSAALLSDRMDARAYYQLSFLKNSYFIQDEKIGMQSYLSAYLPFRNQDYRSVAYLNLPYFSKQYELEEEVSGFIVAFLNIYMFLLFITIIITVFISRYLSKPIQMIKDRIKHLDLKHTNEKISWDKDDEIGELIKEYNRMVDELNSSAQKLALSQRESAWREMAQQIAHEIKNPLTPMKLNVQYLQKAWDDQVDDYEERMKRITKGLQEQIDALSDIAGQFSAFAAMDKVFPEKISLERLIENVVSIFKANAHIDFIVEYDEQDYHIMADKNQMIRVFNNIYKNAVQALVNQPNAKVVTTIIRHEKSLSIEISDNGSGISSDELAYIFEPRFTTKSGGMGLGLALVKKMLENAKGSISVHSVKGEGSRFIIVLPFAI